MTEVSLEGLRKMLMEKIGKEEIKQIFSMLNNNVGMPLSFSDDEMHAILRKLPKIEDLIALPNTYMLGANFNIGMFADDEEYRFHPHDTEVLMQIFEGNLEKTKELIEKYQIDINDCPRSEGTNLLIAAATCPHIETVKYFVEEKGISVHVKDEYGASPLMYAVQEGNFETIKYLVSQHKAKTNDVDDNGISILEYALDDEECDIEIVKYLVEHGARDTTILAQDHNLLFFAFLYNNIDIAKYFIDELGVNINATNKDGYSALFSVYAYGMVDVLPILLEKGADINLQSNDGTTPLIMIVKLGELDAMPMLLEYGANPNLKDKSGKSVLDYVQDKKELKTLKQYIKEHTKKVIA